MIRQRIYPNYTDNFYYEEGDNFILLKRTKSIYGSKPIYQRVMDFDTPEEAEEYFENNCGA